MLHQLRRHLRIFAAIILVQLSALGAWSAVAHGLDCHDPDGTPVVAAHDASAHAFRSAALPAGKREIHCVLCHWARAFGAGVQSVPATPFVVSRARANPAADVSLARLTTAAQPPLRAPPDARPFGVLA